VLVRDPELAVEQEHDEVFVLAAHHHVLPLRVALSRARVVQRADLARERERGGERLHQRQVSERAAGAKKKKERAKK